MNPGEILHRIESLEQANRRLKSGTLIMAADLIAMLFTAARGKITNFDTIVADEIQVRNKLVVGGSLVDDGTPSTSIHLSIEDLPNDTGRGAFISLRHKTLGAMTLSNAGRRPDISVMFEEAEKGLSFYNPKWEVRQR